MLGQYSTICLVEEQISKLSRVSLCLGKELSGATKLANLGPKMTPDYICCMPY